MSDLFYRPAEERVISTRVVLIMVFSCILPIGTVCQTLSVVRTGECEIECEKTFVLSDSTITAGVTREDGPYAFETLPSGARLVLRGKCALSAFKGTLVTGWVTGIKSQELVSELRRNGISEEALVMSKATHFKVRRKDGECVTFAANVDCLERKTSPE